MATQKQRRDQGRAARAADLIATLDAQIPLGHPARATVRELQILFSRRTADVRALLERVPGKSLGAKGERIGLSKGSVWAIWHGRYVPGPETMARIEAAVAEAEQ